MEGMYQHYKGGLYVVLSLARFATNGPHDGETHVVYYSLEKRQLFTREMSDFIKKVTWPDGAVRPRFELMGRTGRPL